MQCVNGQTACVSHGKKPRASDMGNKYTHVTCTENQNGPIQEYYTGFDIVNITTSSVLISCYTYICESIFVN